MKNLVKNLDLIKDVDDIYLGNLGTIDTDMLLPTNGTHGSNFTWRSDEHLFLSDTGKVTRPTPGVGNRTIHLTLTAQLADDVIQKVYDVTILQELRTIPIDHAVSLTINVYDSSYHLPQVTIVQLTDQTYTTSTVTWSTSFDASQTTQHIVGQLNENGMPASLTLNVNLQTPRQIDQPFKDYPVQLLGDDAFISGYQSMLHHLNKINLNQLLYNFRSAAQLSVNDADKMTGWDAPDCNLRGHTTGHYMSALALAYFDSQEPTYKFKLDYLVEELGKCQVALAKNGAHPGFLSAYDETQFDRLETYETYPNIWAPYYTLDKILSGLLDSYHYTNNQQALTIAMGIGDWVTQRLTKLSHAQLMKMWSIYIAGEFGGMISAMVRLARYTNQPDYLETAKLFSNDKLYLPMLTNYDTLNNMHANQHIPQIIGALDLYQETGDPNDLSIAQNFWEIVVDHHTFANGGVGETEMFHEPDTVSKYLTDKPDETCASYNMFKLSRKLFDVTQDAKYMAYAENIFNNHLLVANDHTDAGASTYFLPLRPGGIKHYDTDADNTCCHGSGLESMVRFSKDIYAFDDQRLYVNLFYDSRVNLGDIGQVEQTVTDNQMTLTATLKRPVQLKIRIPKWLSQLQVYFNDVQTPFDCQDGYLTLLVSDKQSTLRLQFIKQLTVVPTPDDQSTISIFYGPDLLVQIDEQETFKHLPITAIDDAQSFIQTQSLVPFNQIHDSPYHVYFKKK